MNDIHYRLEQDSGGIKRITDRNKTVNAVKHWLNTPEGYFLGQPSYGNNLDSFLFSYDNEILDSINTMNLISKMQEDLPNYEISGLALNRKNDVLRITININNEEIDVDVDNDNLQIN